MKTICVCWLWMSQAALLCLLYLVLLTAATIHLYLVADAPNHSILPLIYLNTTPLEYSSVRPGMHSVDPSIHPYFYSSLHPCVHLCIYSSFHPSVRTSICPEHRCVHSSIRPSVCTTSCVNKILPWKIWHIQQYCSDLSCQLAAVGTVRGELVISRHYAKRQYDFCWQLGTICLTSDKM